MISCCRCQVASVVSDCVRPHSRQPTRLRRPCGSPGKNTGVGFRFLLQCVKVKRERELAQSCPTLRNPMDCSLPGSSVHGIFQARVLEWGVIAFSAAATYSLFTKQGRESLNTPSWLICFLPTLLKKVLQAASDLNSNLNPY